jgi:hypothetical protein
MKAMQFFLAEYDFPICAGDCKGTYSLARLKGQYFAAKDVNVHVQLGAGHGLTLHKNATAGYQVIWSYLQSQGL